MRKLPDPIYRDLMHTIQEKTDRLVAETIDLYSDLEPLDPAEVCFAASTSLMIVIRGLVASLGEVSNKNYQAALVRLIDKNTETLKKELQL